MPPYPPRTAPKIFLGAARLEIFWGPASHPTWQNPGSAPEQVELASTSVTESSSVSLSLLFGGNKTNFVPEMR